MDTVRGDHANKDKYQGFPDVYAELLSSSSDSQSWLCRLLMPEVLVEACLIQLLQFKRLSMTSFQNWCDVQCEMCLLRGEA